MAKSSRTLSYVAHQIWDMKYRFKEADGTPIDQTITDTRRRVARALSALEKSPEHWEDIFACLLDDYKFLPAGRILSGAGTGRAVTLFNCFVMGTIPDDMSGIFDNLKEAALTMQQGGGIGYDFSTLRPRGATVHGVGADASGPLSFMDVWDAMCRTIMSAGSRRGAMMGVMRCDHPDIMSFIEVKQDPTRLRMFNLSVLITDAFMEALKADGTIDLTFDGIVYDTIRAQELWNKIARATYDYAEPGVIFIDRINALNNLSYCEQITATNPCGEQPLPPYGACLLGSMNLARYVTAPFDADASLDTDSLARDVVHAVRLMDNVIDVSPFPLDAQRAEAHAKRRLGLGVTGLADALIMCGARYGSNDAIALCRQWLATLRRAAYAASIDLAREKGAFPLFNREAYTAQPHIQTLDEDLQAGIQEHGIRNALLTSIAPTGTISLFADNVSSGVEPVFNYTYRRTILMPDGTRKETEVVDYAYLVYRRLFGDDAPLTDAFADIATLRPQDHVTMQGVVQEYIDSSISKTINVPEDMPFDAFQDIYLRAWQAGCKGCTTYRPNTITGSVLHDTSKEDAHQTQTPASGVASSSTRAPTSHHETPPTHSGASVVYMTEPLARPDELRGRTYKLVWPASNHAIYITLNDIQQDTRWRPFEIFINSKNMEHYAWTVALTRMISAVFRRGGDVSFVVEELKAVFDPRGGVWSKGAYIPSLLAAIGKVIEEHMIAIGFLEKPPSSITPDTLDNNADDNAEETVHTAAVGQSTPMGSLPNKPVIIPDLCPSCGEAAFVMQNGCSSCRACGMSHCD